MRSASRRASRAYRGRRCEGGLLQDPRPRVDTRGMSRRVMLWTVGLMTLGLTYLAAVKISTPITTMGGGSLGGTTLDTVTCSSLWNPIDWFSATCGEGAPERLAALGLGIIAVLVYGYFAENAVGGFIRHTFELTETPEPPRLKTCPDCAEEVRVAARKCRFCGFTFDASAVAWLAQEEARN